jgi:hypothetical protein
MLDELNPITWCSDREVDNVPPHFVKTTTPVSSDSLFWVRASLQGRYSLHFGSEQQNFIFERKPYIAFEDSGEAMMYELRWSGSK